MCTVRNLGESASFLDRFKIDAFVNGIRHTDIKLLVCAAHTFAETVTFVEPLFNIRVWTATAEPATVYGKDGHVFIVADEVISSGRKFPHEATFYGLA